MATRCPTPREVWRWGRVSQARCAKRSCPSCGELWLGDTRVRALAAAGELRGAVALVTVTGPGVGELPWDSSGRRVHPLHAARWNRQAPARWSELHAAALRRAKRELGEDWPDWRLLMKAWEYQKRGILHLHLVVPAGGPRELRASNAYVRALAALAPRKGFGWVDRGKLPAKGARQSSRRLEPVAPARAAAYVAGYLAGTGAGKGGIAEVAAAQGVPGAVFYVARALTTRSGITMRGLRARRTLIARWPNAGSDELTWQAARVCNELCRGRPPLAAGDRDALMEVALSQRWTATVDPVTGEVRGATDAPPPYVRERPQEQPPTGRCVGVVRLDPVLHREAAHPGWVVSSALRLDT